MIVCICRGASDRDVRNAVEGGATCLQTLERRGIGGDCRGCERTLRDFIVAVAGERSVCATCCAPESAFATA
jgi:bacterioferritin-associated ferredoxin